VAGAAYGLAALGGSGGASASEVIPGSGHPWLGVQLSNPSGGGVIVESVVPGSPADHAGIEPGDVIMQVGSQPVNSPADVAAAISNLGVCAQVQIVVLRGAMTITTQATLAGQPAGSP
jgi:S1-C subfamily serine protease